MSGRRCTVILNAACAAGYSVTTDKHLVANRDFADGDLPGITNAGSFDAGDDQIACLEEHGLDLSGDSVTIPEEIARACFDDPGP